MHLNTQRACKSPVYGIVIRYIAHEQSVHVVLQVIAPDNAETKTFVFPATVNAGTTLFDLGLTGTDWILGAKAHPVAWKLELLASDGHPVATEKSFLWEKPAK